MLDGPDKRRVAVLGASGGVGRLVVTRALERGMTVACQTRDAAKLAYLADRVEVSAFDPRDQFELGKFIKDSDVVVFALGVDSLGSTTLFSDVTGKLLDAMVKEGVERLIAITGVGAGETRGHGGFLYDWIVFPLFTRKRYADKDQQEKLILASGLDWTIVRPAPFSERRVPGPLEIHKTVLPGMVLRRVTRDEVAAFVVDQFDCHGYLHERPFIGHP